MSILFINLTFIFVRYQEYIIVELLLEKNCYCDFEACFSNFGTAYYVYESPGVSCDVRWDKHSSAILLAYKSKICLWDKCHIPMKVLTFPLIFYLQVWYSCTVYIYMNGVLPVSVLYKCNWIKSSTRRCKKKQENGKWTIKTSYWFSPQRENYIRYCKTN